MIKSEAITLVFTCNDHFTVMLGALIKSVLVNHTSNQSFNLFVVNDGISVKNIDRINNIVTAHAATVTWLDSASIFESIKLPIDNSSFPRNVYMRLFIPSFLPVEIKKAIYLDVDMICCADIALLWETDLQDNPVAAVRDRSNVVSSEWGGIPNYKELKLDPQTPYFNTGLLIFNMDIWRSQKLSEQIISTVEKNISYANFPDQYGLNVVLASHCLELDFRWNCYSFLDEPNPFIIHFIGNKPIYISYSENQNYASEFFRYLDLTPWKNFKPYSRHTRYLNKILNKLRNKLHLFRKIGTKIKK